MKKIFTFCSVFFIFNLLSFIFVRAQDQPNQSALGVSPAIIEEVLTTGKTQKIKIFVYNVTNFPLPIKGTVANFIAKEEIPQEAKEIFDASSWIKLEPSDFILQPRERKEIEIIIAAPKTAEPGGHYAIVYFQPLIPVEVLSPQTAYLSARVGVLAFLIVQGEIVEKASLEKFAVTGLQSAFNDRLKFRQAGPVDFKVSFKNEGNLHLLPSGKITVWDFRNKEVAKLELKPTNVLPKTSKDFTVSWPKKYLLGKFTAKANILYGSEHQKLESPLIEFWVIPWVLILLLIGVLTVFFIFFILVKRRIILAVKVLFGKAEIRELKKIKLK